MIASDDAAPAAGTVAAEDVVLHYRTYGEGAPLLLLAGGPGMSGDYLLPVAAELAEYRTIVLDQRGTGRSTMARLDAASMTLAHAVEDVERLRARLELERWSVLGHSWGGVLAMAYAARHPERVQALVLAGSGGPTTDFLRYLPGNVQSRLSAEAERQLAYWSDGARVQADPQRAGYEHFRVMARAYVCLEKHVELILRGVGPEHFDRRTTVLMQSNLLQSEYDLRPALAALPAEVLIVQGRQDVVGESTAYALANALPQARLEWIERCGHFPWLERPQPFFAAVRTCLRSAGAASARKRDAPQ